MTWGVAEVGRTFWLGVRDSLVVEVWGPVMWGGCRRWLLDRWTLHLITVWLLAVVSTVHHDPPAAAAAGERVSLTVFTLLVTLPLNFPIKTSKKLSAL